MILLINHVNPAIPNAVTTLHPWALAEKDSIYYLHARGDQFSLLEVIKYILRQRQDAKIMLRVSEESDFFYELEIDERGRQALKDGSPILFGNIKGFTLSDLIANYHLSLQQPVTNEDVRRFLSGENFESAERVYVREGDRILCKPKAECVAEHVERAITRLLEEKRARIDQLKISIRRAGVLCQFCEYILARRIHVSMTPEGIAAVFPCSAEDLAWVTQQPIATLSTTPQKQLDALEHELSVLVRQSGEALLRQEITIESNVEIRNCITPG